MILEEDTGDQVIPVYTLRDGDAMGWSALTADAVTHSGAGVTPRYRLWPFPAWNFAPGDQDPANGLCVMKRLLELVMERLPRLRG